MTLTPGCRLQVTSQDKAPAVVAKVLEKHNHDRRLAPGYELVQLLPEGQGEARREASETGTGGQELAIPGEHSLSPHFIPMT